jgi:hypothetical protein
MRALARELDALASETGFSGVVRVDRADRVLAKAYGLASRGYQIANEVDTRFAIASGTKGLTALTVVSLIEDGLLELSTTARRCSVRIWAHLVVAAGAASLAESHGQAAARSQASTHQPECRISRRGRSERRGSR